MIWSPSKTIRTSLVLAGVLLGWVGFHAPSGGQELPWLGKGKVRLDMAPGFWGWDSRFGYAVGADGGVEEVEEPLSLDLTADPLGSGPIPHLRKLEGYLQEALGDGGYRVRLGASQAIVAQSRLVLPIRLELGITDWLTVGAMVPLVRPRTEMDFYLDADSTNANVGLSPYVTDPGTVAVFLNTFQQVVSAGLESDPSNQTLLAAQAYQKALAGALQQGSVFPVSGSPAGIQLQARLDELRAELEALGVTGVPGVLPMAAGYMDETSFSDFLGTERGMLATPLEDWTTPWALGDIEISAAARVLRGEVGADSVGAGATLRFQLGVGGLVRLGTGLQADPNRFFSQDPADGQTDIEGSVFGTVEFLSRVGVWGQLRYGVQMEGEVLRRIAAPDEVLPNWGRLANLNWTPGNYMEVDLAPWFFLTPDMTFGVRYHLWHKGEDSYALPPIDPEILAALDYPDPALLNQETEETLQELGFSATYSTLGPNARGLTPIPLQLRATYFRPLSGSGGQTPKGGRLEMGLTLYRTLWGGGQ